MGAPRTTREALIAQMLGELDELLTRAERLPRSIAEAEARVAITAQVLNDAGDKYRVAVAAFTEEAKAALTEHAQHTMSQVVSDSVDEQRRIIQALHTALRLELAEQFADGRAALKPAPHQACQKRRERLLEQLVTAMIASILTAAFVFVIVERI